MPDLTAAIRRISAKVHAIRQFLHQSLGAIVPPIALRFDCPRRVPICKPSSTAIISGTIDQTSIAHGTERCGYRIVYSTDIFLLPSSHPIGLRPDRLHMSSGAL